MNTQNYIKGIALIAIALMFTACDNYGTKLEFADDELYYTDQVTEEEATKLGEYLEDGYFSEDGKTVSVQLDKDGDKYLVKFVVDEAKIDEEDKIAAFTLLQFFIQSEVFDGAETEIHLCDEYIKTLKVVGDSSDEEEDSEESEEL